MKKVIISVLAGIILLAAVLLILTLVSTKGSTVSEREILLDKEYEGYNWSVVSEITVDGYIISGACGAGDNSVLAVFSPKGKNGYKLYRATVRDSRDIIVSDAYIAENWYNIIWLYADNLDRAEITYLTKESGEQTIIHNAQNGEIYCGVMPGGDYELRVEYITEDGKRIE